VDLGQQLGNREFAAVGQVVLARVEHLQLDMEKAREAMHAAGVIAHGKDSSTRWSLWVECALARLWLAQGNPEPANQLLKAKDISFDGDISYALEPVYLVLMRMLLSHGEFDRAAALSERLLEPAEVIHRTGMVIETLVLQALAFQGKRDLDRALCTIEKAMALAEPERYARVFLDEGEPMARLLYQARAHHRGTVYLSQLLSALPSPSDAAGPVSQPLVEPLSTRELEVLRLIVAGCSNDEIAARLIISIKTAKRHISNIYGKLGVKSRTQAVALARELNLIE
jgi:LuxR family maltose regulon positive regulatory protein